MATYRDLGYSQFGTKVIETFIKDTPIETRNSSQPGALVSDGVYVGSANDVVKIDKDGLYAGNAEFASSKFSVSTTGQTKIPVLTDIPINPVNGYIWMEADGLHIYYNGGEHTVQVV